MSDPKNLIGKKIKYKRKSGHTIGHGIVYRCAYYKGLGIVYWVKDSSYINYVLFGDIIN